MLMSLFIWTREERVNKSACSRRPSRSQTIGLIPRGLPRVWTSSYITLGLCPRGLYYTCNVSRLRECHRLGTEKEIGLWFTHFFTSSPHFDDVFAAIFNQDLKSTYL